jgi:HK97 family phage prohead protease
METKTVNVTFKAGPDDGLAEGEFLVYPSTFTKTPDSYGDVVRPGAFADTLAEWKSSGLVLPGLYGHRMDDPDYNIAFAKDTGEDEHGWWVKGQFDLESPKGPTVYRLVKGKRLNQLSFAYDVQDEGQIELEDGTKANELRKVKVYEFSFVPVGANQDTSVVAVKATADALVGSVKEGRVLAAKHIDSLRKAQEAISSVIAAADAQEDDQEKASGQAVTNDEEPVGAKSEESSVNPSVESWESQIALEERKAHAYSH